MQRIKVDDEVVIIAGKDKGKQGRVLRVDREHDRVLVEGVNMAVRHKKSNPQNPSEGGRVTGEAMLHLSNVMPWSEKDGKGVRVRISDDEGKRERVSVPSGAPVGTAGARAAQAKKKAKKSDEDDAK